MRVLLLGPGRATWRLPPGSPPFCTPSETIPPDLLTVIDRDRNVLDFWRTRGARSLSADLRHIFGSILLRSLSDEAFDEVHAYELLNLLPGESGDFFRLWRFIWDCLAPGGKVYAAVPHWESQWIHAYPAPQRTYTPGLLGHLNQFSSNAAQEDFGREWPKPYSFRLENSWVLSGIDGKPQGWHFLLVKEEAGT